MMIMNLPVYTIKLLKFAIQMACIYLLQIGTYLVSINAFDTNSMYLVSTFVFDIN